MNLKFGVNLFFLMFVFGIIVRAQDIKMLLPEEDSTNGWAQKNEPEVLMAGNFDNTDFIDLITEFGFEQMIQTFFVKERHKISVRIFEMKADRGAYGLFSINNDVVGQNFAYGNPGVIYADSLVFRKGRYYVIIKDENTTGLLGQQLNEIAIVVATNITDGGSIPQLTIPFLKKGLSVFEIDFIRGPISFSKTYFFHYKDIFGYTECATGSFDGYKIMLMVFNEEYDCVNGIETSKQVISRKAKFRNYQETTNGYSAEDIDGVYFNFYRFANYIVCYIGSKNNFCDSIMTDFIENINDMN